VVVQTLTGLYWRRLGRPEVALTYIHRAAAGEPQQAMWLLELGNTLTEMGDLIGALSYYQRAVEMEPENPLYWKALARFCLENGADIRGTGLPAARWALLLSPDDAEALDLMGWTFLRLGDSLSAERFLQQALQQDSHYSAAHLHLSQLYLQLGKEELAFPHLQRIRSIEGPDEQAGEIARRLLERYFGQ
jgi:tetratricopeptide (TPR) repeat protein